MKRECPWVLATADAYRWLLLLLSPLLLALLLLYRWSRVRLPPTVNKVSRR